MIGCLDKDSSRKDFRCVMTHGARVAGNRHRFGDRPSRVCER